MGMAHIHSLVGMSDGSYCALGEICCDSSFFNTKLTTSQLKPRY
ncbi:hypothetical protein OIU77_015642 [Salix suchowensis]|uniref:Uncharacterized protein n=1 Tax=Salix suchowensis TaxID=1278906 RepID=A0ABQ8ZHY7_9ROSI|nr:hypothetical protein OIU77_015642 [Salix suchowensis]